MKFIIKKHYKLYRSDEYQEWFDDQGLKSQLQIDERLFKIEEEGYFGDHKFLTNTEIIWELRWLNGRRVYYAYIAELDIVLLLGGNKNGQSKDITRAKKIFRKYIKV